MANKTVEPVDPIHFQNLAKENPKTVCKRAACQFNDDTKCYTITVWGHQYEIYPEQKKIVRQESNSPNPHSYFDLFIISYLLKPEEIRVAGEWISEKDFAGGPTFFRGPHEIPTSLISGRFAGNVEGFKEYCQTLSGTSIEMADGAYIFNITPCIPVAVLFWDGDDEFPAETKILYDRSLTDHFTLDIIFALAVDICTRIGNGSQ